VQYQIVKQLLHLSKASPTCTRTRIKLKHPDLNMKISIFFLFFLNV